MARIGILLAPQDPGAVSVQLARAPARTRGDVSNGPAPNNYWIGRMVMDLDEQYERRIGAADDVAALARILQELLERCSLWTDGKLLYIKARVDHVHGLRIEIYPLEHPPPHFHVKPPT